MGDVLTLIEDIEKKTDKEKSLKLSKKIKKGKGFNLDDFKDQIKQMSWNSYYLRICNSACS